MQKKNKTTFGFRINYLLFGVATGVILVALAIGVGVSSRTNIMLDNNIAETNEAARPAEIEITILVAEACSDCFSVGPIIDDIKKQNVQVNSEETVDITSAEGMELISTYSITTAPAFIVSGETEKESSLTELWGNMGGIEDGVFVFRQSGAPYIETASGDIRGRAGLTMIALADCTECYDVTSHQGVLRKFGFLQEGEVLDTESIEGKELVEKYNIEMLPTIILDGDVAAYSGLTKAWAKVGTIEDDGAYVFREGVKSMGTYKNLTSGEIINPAEESQASEAQDAPESPATNS